MSWQQHFSTLKDGALKLAVEKLDELIHTSLEDSSQVLQEHAGRVESYLEQLAADQIDKVDFEEYMLDLADLVEMEALKQQVKTQAAMQSLADGIRTLVIHTICRAL